MQNLLRETAKNPEEYPQEDIPMILGMQVINEKLCAKCGGKCCKNAPCHYAPSDFEDLSFEGLKKVIDAKGYISIVKIPIFEYDYYKEFSDQTYFYILRIKRIGDPCAFKMEKKPLPRLCSLWTKKGCKLCFEDRPTGAKHLVPRENMRCLQLYSLEKCICDWKPYTKTLKALYRYYKRRAFFDVLRKKAK